MYAVHALAQNSITEGFRSYDRRSPDADSPGRSLVALERRTFWVIKLPTDPDTRTRTGRASDAKTVLIVLA